MEYLGFERSLNTLYVVQSWTVYAYLGSFMAVWDWALLTNQGNLFSRADHSQGGGVSCICCQEYLGTNMLGIKVQCSTLKTTSSSNELEIQLDPKCSALQRGF